MTHLGGLVERPVVVAPMGGGPSTPALVIAAAEAGALGFLAAGYKTAVEVEAEIRAVRAATSRPFGVNVFVPGSPTRDAARLDEFVRELGAEADAHGVELGPATWDDDDWDAKTELAVETSPPVCSFTFGCPPLALVDALKRRGTLVAVTVTSASEARIAADAGADVLCAQGIEAGAHRGSFVDDQAADDRLSAFDLLAAIRHAIDTPVILAGGIGLPEQVRAALDAGAAAVQCGTAFLRCSESGAHPAHKAALTGERFTETAFTRSFSGRLARGLVNRFMRDYPSAPTAYPEINNATRPLRAAAMRRSDADGMSLWAGTGYRDAREDNAANIVRWLSSETEQ